MNSGELTIALIGAATTICGTILGVILGGVVTFVITEYGYQRKKREENRRIAFEWIKNNRIASLRGFNLRRASLQNINLDADESNKGVDLSYADLSYADLRGASLRYANLSNANLSEA